MLVIILLQYNVTKYNFDILGLEYFLYSYFTN